MQTLYHGSSQSDLTKLLPHQSTHGNFVYATKNKELAIIFSGRCGDDLTYTLFRNNDNEPWQVVERIPGAFAKMFNNSSSIYTVPSLSFKDIHTGFSEFVSDVSVNIDSEEKIENVYKKLKELDKSGIIKLYHYPNRPKEIPIDDTDLIRKQINQANRNHQEITKKTFRRLLYLHPNLFHLVNQKLSSISSDDLFTKQDLVENFESFILQQMLFPDREQYLGFSTKAITTTFPELSSQIQEKLSLLDKTKSEQIDYLIDKLFKTIPTFPKYFVQQAREYYQKDKRTFSEIGREIIEQYQKIEAMESLVNQEINPDISNQSILMIGPMGAGKSTIAKKLGENLNMPVISLDNRKQLIQYYSKQKEFSNFKDFEFYLTSSILTILKAPAIIDFGAGHSIYENDIMFYEMKKLISKFSNVVYIIPSKDKEASLKILNQRLKERVDYSPQKEQDNRHFLTSNCNTSLATITEYTDLKSIDEIAWEVLEQIDNRKKKETKSSSVIHTLKKKPNSSLGFTNLTLLIILIIITIFSLILVNFLK